MHNNKKAIPTFQPESEFDSDTQCRFFACPASGENVYTWKMDKIDYPEELLFISHGETINEPIYVKSEYQHIVENGRKQTKPCVKITICQNSS